MVCIRKLYAGGTGIMDVNDAVSTRQVIPDAKRDL
jgi:hypothetical protein